MYLDTKATVDGFVGPADIDTVYCIHGSEVPTTSGMVYTPANAFHSAFPDQMPTLLTDDGDGTVNLRSLQPCSRWKGVKYEVLPGANHLSIIQDKRFIGRLLDIANARPVKSWFQQLLDRFQ